MDMRFVFRTIYTPRVRVLRLTIEDGYVSMLLFISIFCLEALQTWLSLPVLSHLS